MRVRSAFVLGVLLVASCAEGNPQEPPRDALTASTDHGAAASPKGSGAADAATKTSPKTTEGAGLGAESGLAPLARDARSRCDVARAKRDRAKDLIRNGRAYRALRELDAAAAACPADAGKGSPARLEALIKLGRIDDARALAKTILDAPDADADAKKAARDAASAPAPSSSTGAALLASAQASKARGDAANEIQKLFDQALVRIEQEANAKSSLLWAREASRPLALSADASVAVFARGSTAVLTDASRLLPVRFFDHEHSISDAALSRDGQLLATVDEEGGLSVWSTSTGKRVQRLAWAGERAQGAVFTSDGKRLVAVSGAPFDSAMRLWNIETGDSIAAFASPGHGEPKSFALSRDDKFLAVGTERGQLEIWSMGPKPKVAFVLAGRESFLESAMSIAFSPKGDRLVATFESGDVGVWDTANGKQVWTADTKGSFQKPGACAFSADGKRVLSGWDESRAGATIRAWDAVTGAEQKNTPAPGRAIGFSDDGKRALLEGERAAAIVDLSDNSSVATRPIDLARVEHVRFFPPRVLAVDLDRDESLRLVLPAGMRSLPLGDSSRMLAPSIDGSMIGVSLHSEITLWDLATGRAIENLPRLDFFPDSIALTADGSARASAAFSAIVLASLSPDRASWIKVFSRSREDVSFPSLKLATFGRRALAVMGEELGVIDADSGQGRVLDHGSGRLGSAMLSPDGRIVFLEQGEQIQRLDAATGASLGPGAPLGCNARDLSVSFDGSRIAAPCDDGAKIVTFSGGPGAATLMIPIGRDVRDIDIAPHGDLLVSAHNDGAIQLWGVDDGRPIGRIRFLPGKDAAMVEAMDGTGRVELVGSKAADLEQELLCRVGSAAYPFDLCRDAVIDEGLLAELFAAR